MSESMNVCRGFRRTFPLSAGEDHCEIVAPKSAQPLHAAKLIYLDATGRILDAGVCELHPSCGDDGFESVRIPLWA